MKALHYSRTLLAGFGILLLSVYAFGSRHQDEKMNGGRYDGRQERDTAYLDTNGMYYDTVPDTNGAWERDGMRDTARADKRQRDFFEANGYDTTETLSVAGTVDSVETTDEVVILSMITDQGRLKVHTAPQWYLDEQGLTFSEGDSLQVTGRPQALNGETALIATQVKVYTNTAKFRKEGGAPLWDRPRTGFWDNFRWKRR